MPDNDVWPPKPSLPEPLAEHDALIGASLPTLSAVTLDYDLVLPLSGVPFSNSAWVMNWTLRIKNPLSPMSERLERRLRLTQVLMEERGLDSMHADAVVQDYYQRHGMAEIPKGAGKSLALSLVMIALAFVAALSGALDFFLSFHRDVILSRPNHGAAIIALDNARSLLRTVAFALLGLVYGFWLLRFLVRRVRHKRHGFQPVANAVDHINKAPAMPDNDTWLPKPALPDPLTEYDDVIAAKLAALSAAKTRPSRLLLTKSLLEEKGLDLRQAYAFVAGYCDRHDVLIQPKTSLMMSWLGCLLPLSMLGLAVFDLWLGYRRTAIMRLPHHHAAFLAIRREGLIVVCAILALLLLNMIIMVPRIRSLRKK